MKVQRFVFVVDGRISSDFSRWYGYGKWRVENMIEDVELFDSPPLLKDLVDRVISKHSCGIDEISLRGRFDCGKAEHIMF